MKASLPFIKTTKWVFQIYWGISRVLISLVMITQIILQLRSLLYAYVSGLAIDTIILLIQQGHIQIFQVVQIVFAFVVFDFVYSLIGIVNNRASNLLGNRDVWVLRQRLYEHLHKLGLAVLEDSELTNKTTRFGEIYGFISQYLTLNISLIASVLTLIASGIVVGGAIPILVPFFIILFLLKFFVNQKFISEMWSFNRSNTEYRRKAFTVGSTLSDPQSLKELIITRGTEYLNTFYKTYVATYIKKTDSIYSGWMRFEIFQTVLDAVLFGIALYLIINKGLMGLISIGTITFLVRAMSTFTEQLDSLSYRIARVKESAIRIKDVEEIFYQYGPDNDGTINLDVSKVAPDIILENVDFKYPNSELLVFNGLSLHIKSGEKIAIVGENGAGKTTLVKILSRLYRVDEGKVLISGVNINDIKISSFYDKLGILFQDFNKYEHLSVAENVGIGSFYGKKINEKRVIEALEKADALDFVNKYPNRLNQVLSERYRGGIRPSTGQWQKIAIARFFYRDAPMLILDEPTAAIDAISEAQIFDNIYKFMKGKTVIIISHRFSTVRNADRIIVLDKGRIIEDGSHEELLAKGGKYAKSFKLQAKGYI